MTRRIDVAPPRTRAWPRQAAAPFPPRGPGAAQALLAEVRALGLAAGDEVLVPAWHLGPAAAALAAAGLVPRFHDLGPRLAPDPDELAALLGPRVRALWLVHYLGFPQDAPGWLAWCRQRGLLLLEDATAAPPATPGDAAARRRANYRILLAELTGQVPTPFARLPEGAVPLVLPVEADDRAALLRRLDRHRVGALDFRAGLPPGLPEGRFPNAARLATRTVGLPVHQRLHPRDLDRIAAAARTRPRRPAELTLELAEELGPLRPLWIKLAERGRNLFGTWEWAATWWRHHGQGRRLSVIVVRRAGEPVGLLPLYHWRSRPLAVLRFLGHGPADELGPVGDPDDGVLLARALRRSLRRLDADLLLAEQLPRGQDWGALLGGRRLAAEASPVVRFGADGWEAYLAARSANFREQIRRRARKLAREHPVGYRLSDGSRDLDRDLDTLFRLHAARWADAPTNFLAEEAFHRTFAPVAAGQGWLRLWFLEVHGQAVAALYGFRYAGTESYYQAGRDPAWSHQRIGFVLLAHAIRQAAQDGIAEYRLLRGGEDYKQRFAVADPGLETVALARGSLASAALPALTAARAAPGPLGRLARQVGAGALHR